MAVGGRGLCCPMSGASSPVSASRSATARPAAGTVRGPPPGAPGRPVVTRQGPTQPVRALHAVAKDHPRGGDDVPVASRMATRAPAGGDRNWVQRSSRLPATQPEAAGPPPSPMPSRRPMHQPRRPAGPLSGWAARRGLRCRRAGVRADARSDAPAPGKRRVRSPSARRPARPCRLRSRPPRPPTAPQGSLPSPEASPAGRLPG